VGHVTKAGTVLTTAQAFIENLSQRRRKHRSLTDLLPSWPVTTVEGTRTSSVYETLRADLLAGRIEPGSKLRLAALGSRFDVSLSVVREALTRLSEQGLVVANPNRGFSAVSLSREDLVDLTRTRVDIETLAVRRSVADGSLEWETALVAAHHQLARTRLPDPGDWAPDGAHDAWVAAHRRFHRALLAGCGSSRLEAIATGLRDSAELYRIWSRSIAHDDDRDIACEHRRLTDLAIARDVEGTAEALAAHIQRTTDALLRYVDGA
jgi:DNA-binding GntR family transcriptional regulator